MNRAKVQNVGKALGDWQSFEKFDWMGQVVQVSQNPFSWRQGPRGGWATWENEIA